MTPSISLGAWGCDGGQLHHLDLAITDRIDQTLPATPADPAAARSPSVTDAEVNVHGLANFGRNLQRIHTWAKRRRWGVRALLALTVLSLAPGAGACGSSPSPCPAPDEPLRELADARGLVLGTAYREAYEDGDACYETVATAEFNSLTPEIATFSNRLAVAGGSYDFTEADAICDLAQANDMHCQLHALIWDPVDHPEWGIVPAWIRDQPPEQRQATMTDYVTAVVSHFAGRIEANTLVNEAFDAAGQLTPSVWNTTDDDSYIFDAYRAARRADPQAKLFYNDFGAEDVNPKSDAIFDLVQRLHAETVRVEIDGSERDVPLIDGVGLQMHVGIGPGQAPDPASVAANIDRLGRAGLTVRITEMDVRLPVDAAGQATPEDLERQEQMYGELIDVCVAAEACDGVAFWGHTDARSWITENPQAFPGQGAAHPLDAQYSRKPAYEAIRAALA